MLNAIENILYLISENFLPLNTIVAREQLQQQLQKIADELLPVFDVAMDPIPIRLKDDLRGNNAHYLLTEHVIEISTKYLSSCQDKAGLILGTLLHEVTHAYIAHKYGKDKKFSGRCKFANGHHVWFFVKALELQAELEVICNNSSKLKKFYGLIELNLKTTLEKWPPLKRRYDIHYEKAKSNLYLRQINEIEEEQEPIGDYPFLPMIYDSLI